MATGGTKRAWKLQEYVAHGGNVNCLALGRKSGRVMVTGGEDKKVNIWVVGKPNSLMSLTGHTSPIETVRFSHDEDMVVAGSASGAMKVWDLEAAKIIRTLTGHKANIRSVDFHPFGDFVASGSLDSNIKLWDVKRKGCIFTYKGHTKGINSLRFSPDGRWLASAGEDGLVKLWDLTAGRPLHDFQLHTAGVTCVEFHPNEFLLASGSADRTVKFWDLETFDLVSSTDSDATAIRSLCFHPEGTFMYAAAHDTIKVHSWEPTQTYDSLVVGWGKVCDISIALNQLIGATIYQSNVSSYVVNIQRVQPLGGPEYSVPPAPTHPVHLRRSFTAERPPTSSAKRSGSQPAEQPDDGGNDVSEENSQQDAAEIQDPNYKEIFNPSRTLSRSPPKEFPAPPEDNEPPAPVPVKAKVTVAPPPAAAPPPSNKPPRPSASSQAVPAKSRPVTSSSSANAVAPPPPAHQESAKPPAAVHRPPPQEPVKTPAASQRKKELDPQDFLPKQSSSMNEAESLTFIMKGHNSVGAVLGSRGKNLQIVRAMYNGNNMKSALDSAISNGDKAVLVDLLNVMVQRNSLWSLDICNILIPQLKELMDSKYESYMQSGCSGLRVILKNFATVIKSNVIAPPSVGVDITREERYHKCKACYQGLMQINSQLSEKLSAHAKLSPQIRELQLLMGQLD